MILEGEAGIGKTTLLDEAKRIARDAGMAVGDATAIPLEHEIPYGVVRQLLEPVLGDLDAAARDVVLSGAARLAAGAVFPWELPEVGPQPVDDPRFPVVHGLFWVVANLAARAPLMLAVDDAQWCDAPSLRFLSYLANRVHDLAVVVVVAYRTGEATDVGVAFGDVAEKAGTVELRPEGLSVDGVAAMASELLGRAATAEFAAACHAATGGVPFLVHELLRAVDVEALVAASDAASLVDRIAPDSIAAATTLRLSHLSPDAPRVARAVAVLGRHAGVRLVGRLADVPDEQLQASADELAAAGILAVGRPLAFAHPIVASTLYEAMPAGQRALAHGRAARLLAEEGADPADVAAHLTRCDPAADGWAVPVLRRAAAQANARGAPETAVVYLERALREATALDTRGEIFLDLGRAKTRLQDPSAVADLEEALRLAESDPERIDVICELVQIFVASGLWGEAVARTAWARETLDKVDPIASVRLETLLAGFAAFDPARSYWIDQERPRLERVIADLPTESWPLQSILAFVDVYRVDDAQAAISRLEQLVASGKPSGPEQWIMQLLSPLGVMEHLDSVELLSKALLADARAAASAYGVSAALCALAWIDGLRGDLRAQEADLTGSFELLREHHILFGLPSLAHFGLDAIVERPGLSELCDTILTTELDPAFAATLAGAWMLEARARLRLARGQPDAAVDDLRASGKIADALGVRHPSISAWRSSFALAILSDDRDAARQLLSDELSFARATGLRRPEGIALRVAGIVERGARGLDLFRESLAVLDGSLPLERARTLVELGSATRRAGSRREARGMLREALALAQRCGALRLIARIQDELAATGARRVDRPVSGWDALTSSEARVARLAAEGMTNSQIAQALFVSMKTVEKHLGATYSKLDIGGRHQLPDTHPMSTPRRDGR